MSTNKLKMNASKTKYMIIRSIRKELKRNVKLKCMDGTVIERVEKIKYLGIVIDSKLRLEDHCDYILKKCYVLRTPHVSFRDTYERNVTSKS